MSTATPNSGRRVLISGGSRGLGLEFAEHLVANGHRVGTFARHETAGIRNLTDRYPDQLRFQTLDATDSQAVARFVSCLVAEFGGIDGLVNNAAIGQDHLLVHASGDVIRKLLAVNLEAPILLTRLVLKQMLLQGNGGRIVNITSVCGSRGYPGLTVYSAAKGAMDAFTRSLAREVGERGILVNSIAPGFFESEMSSILLPEQIASIRRRTPTGYLTTGAQITQVLDLLLFGDTNMTGQSLLLDGGISI